MDAVRPTTLPPDRLRSLDALRGFDMFWIAGGAVLVQALAEATGWGPLVWMESQTHHTEWHGFSFWDLIFPLFLFIAGVAMPYSLTARIERGHDRRRLHLHVVRRGLSLVALGFVYNGLLAFDWEHMRYASVLGRIGLGYMFAALIVMNCGVRAQVMWLVGILLGYWAAMSWIPVPEFGAGNLEPGETLADWVDRTFLPGRLHRTVRDPEGILSTVPAVATALLGAMAGHRLRMGSVAGLRKVGELAGAGVAAMLLGALWHLVFPLNKNLWSSSFVLFAGGLSLALLAAFYLVIDVWGFRRWSLFFVVIGMNAITIYLLEAFVDFDGLAAVVFAHAPRKLHAGLLPLGGIFLRWVLLYGMYKKKLFLRV